MKISEVEKELSISREAIRYYIRRGLLKPARQPNGYRSYDRKDLQLLKRIIILRSLSVRTDDIRDAIYGRVDLHMLLRKSLSVLEQKRGDIDASICICKDMLDRKCDISFEPDKYYSVLKR